MYLPVRGVALPNTKEKTVHKVNILVPSYNEEACLRKTIASLVKELKDHKVSSYEILIFDDGSTDATFLVAKEIQENYSHITVYRSEQNVSLAGSFKYALNYFNYGHFTWIPADGEINPKIIIKLIEASCEQTVTYSNPQKSVAARGYLRTILSKIYQYLIRMTFRVPVSYFNASALYPLEALKGIRIESEGFAVNAELIIKSSRLGFKFKAVDFTLEKRAAGQANAITFRNLYKVIKSYLKLVTIDLSGS